MFARLYKVLFNPSLANTAILFPWKQKKTKVIQRV